jgi:hypothetical protein
MKSNRVSRPSWQVVETWAPRPEMILGAAVVLGMLLVEVWQTSRMTQLCLAMDQTRSACVQANARCDYLRAAAERSTTRAELVPLAGELGLAPADAGQIVLLPSAYLADDRTMIPRDEGSVSLLAWAERMSSAVVPEATARARTDD